MSVRSWSLNLQDAVTFMGLLRWGECSSHPPRWCQPGSRSHLAVVFPDAVRPSLVGPRLNVLVVVDHDYDAAVVVVQVAGGDVAEDGPGAPEPVPGRHPGSTRTRSPGSHTASESGSGSGFLASVSTTSYARS